jgi:hypothetical protein
MTTILEIQKGLQALREKDPHYTLFGSGHHKYISNPLTEQEINSLESQHNVSLPIEYRTFLMEVGLGAGPGYGIMSISAGIALWSDDDEFLGLEKTDISKPFPHTDLDVKTIFSSKKLDPKYTPKLTRAPCDGALPICDMGCTFRYVLVITGEQRGKIWYLNHLYGGKGHWYPTTPRKHLSFYEWYLGWIENSLKELANS